MGELGFEAQSQHLLSMCSCEGKPLTCLSLSLLIWKMGERRRRRLYWASCGDLSGCLFLSWFSSHLTLCLLLRENLSFASEDPSRLPPLSPGAGWWGTRSSQESFPGRLTGTAQAGP